MILVDFNQVVISNMMMQPMNELRNGISEEFVRHMVLNTIRANRQKFTDEYGELVICCDSKRYWRREIFPYYKANRKKDRLDSGIDWNSIFNFLNKIRDELKENFPYKVILVEGAEADDVIGSIVQKYGKKPPYDSAEKIMILSSDKDFIQLQAYGNVEQYDPVRKKSIKHADPKQYLLEHIMKGDRGDGIPNFISSDDCLVLGVRQKPMTEKRIADFLAKDITEFKEDEQRGYKRNEQLINLNYIPKDLQDKIINEYDTQEVALRANLLNYFIKNKLRNLTEHIGEF